MSCPSCRETSSPFGVYCMNCEPAESASTGTGTVIISSEPVNTPDGAAIADIPLPKIGIPPEYVSILTDIADMLAGREDVVDVTPLLQLATWAIEFELAERLQDGLDPLLDVGGTTH